jgi:hypothetical protein
MSDLFDFGQIIGSVREDKQLRRDLGLDTEQDEQDEPEGQDGAEDE